jgi:cytochrome c oxidase subunit 2
MKTTWQQNHPHAWYHMPKRCKKQNTLAYGRGLRYALAILHSHPKVDLMLLARVLKLAPSIAALGLATVLFCAQASAVRAQDAAQPAAADAQKTEAAPVLSAAEKAAAIADVDKITAFDPAKVVGKAKEWQIYFQDAHSPAAKIIHELHDFVFVIICLITLFVTALMVYVCIRFSRKNNPNPQNFTHNSTVEIIWTVIPILILVAIGIPSIRAHYQVIYNEDTIANADLTLKVVAHQWYWSYEYPAQGIVFDSNIIKTADLKNGAPRLLSVDNPLVVPVGKVVRVQVTAADVIHNFAMPALALKKDAVPGRLNETWFKAEKEGIYYGQCDQLCGKLHGFMPIEIRVVSDEEFERWVKGAKLKFAASDHLQFAQLGY